MENQTTLHLVLQIADDPTLIGPHFSSFVLSLAPGQLFPMSCRSYSKSSHLLELSVLIAYLLFKGMPFLSIA